MSDNDELDELTDEEKETAGLDEDTKALMAAHGLDEAGAEHVQELMEEYGVDEDEAVDLETEI